MFSILPFYTMQNAISDDALKESIKTLNIGSLLEDILNISGVLNGMAEGIRSIEMHNEVSAKDYSEMFFHFTGLHGVLVILGEELNNRFLELEKRHPDDKAFGLNRESIDYIKSQNKTA